MQVLPNERYPNLESHLLQANAHWPAEVVLQLVYARLDSNVTRGVNHLLKSPFSCHPKTGRVAVPLRAALADRFLPELVPRVELVYRDAKDRLKSTIFAASLSTSWARSRLIIRRPPAQKPSVRFL